MLKLTLLIWGSPSLVFSLCTSSYVGSLAAISYGGGAEKSNLGGGKSSMWIGGGRFDEEPKVCSTDMTAGTAVASEETGDELASGEQLLESDPPPKEGWKKTIILISKLTPSFKKN